MNKNLKQLPKFKNEDEERSFWANHSASEYFDFDSSVVNPPLPNLKPSTERVTLRLPQNLLHAVKNQANQMDMPYQTLIKQVLFKNFFPSKFQTKH